MLGSLITAITTFFYRKQDEQKNIKEQCSILAMKIDSLLKEIGEGLDMIKNGPNDPPKLLPERKWREEPITNKDVSIISAVSKSDKDKTVDFPPIDIKDCCENYYENITKHWQKISAFSSSLREDKENIQKDIEETKKLIDMLKKTKALLEKNS